MPKKPEPDTRERILQATAKLMRTKGLSKTTTRLIAREAGVADGAVFYHFKDRLDLFLQMLATIEQFFEVGVGCRVRFRGGVSRVEPRSVVRTVPAPVMRA